MFTRRDRERDDSGRESEKGRRMSDHIPPMTESGRRRRTSDYISREPPRRDHIAAELRERDLLEKRHIPLELYQRKSLRSRRISDHIPWERYERASFKRRTIYDDIPREHWRYERASVRRRPNYDDSPRELWGYEKASLRRRPNYDDIPKELWGKKPLSEREHAKIRRRRRYDEIPPEEFKREWVGMSSEHIPQELLIEILKRLSPRELVRFMSVSKSWYSLITSPYFVSLHTNQSAATNSDLLLVRTYSERSTSEHYSIHLDNDTFEDWKSLDFPFKSCNSCFRVIGCVNGVICLSDDEMSYNNVMILWNPSIRKYVSLPSTLVSYCSHGPYMQAFGFGFNATTNDYKVVRLVYLEGYEGSSEAPPLVEVYQLSVGSWRYVDSKGFPYIVEHGSSEQVFLNGNIHWIGYLNPSFNTAVVTFNVEMEELGVIKLPLDIPPVEQFYSKHRVAVFHEDFLSLIDHNFSGSSRSMYDIWVMKQYGVSETWTKYYSDALPENSLAALGFRKNGKILVRSSEKGSVLVTCDPSSGMQVEDHGECGQYVFVGKFVESLSLLGVRGDSKHLLPRNYLKARSKSRR